MRHLIIITTAVLFFTISSWGQCGNLVSELKAMQTAQSSIQSSLIANHEMFATTLESYSEALKESAGKAHKVISSNMISSSESFRARGLKAQKTALKLEDATTDLIQRITQCLK